MITLTLTTHQARLVAEVGSAAHLLTDELDAAVTARSVNY